MNKYGKSLQKITDICVLTMALLYGATASAGIGPGSERDPEWDHIYNSTGIGFGAVETPTGWQPLMDVTALDLQGEHGFLTFEGRFALGSYSTMGGERDGKMGYTQLNLLTGFGTPWLQLGTGIVHVSTDLGTDSGTLDIPYQSFDTTRKVIYSTTTAPLLIKVVPLRTDSHYLTASAMVYKLSSAASADIPITLLGLANGTTTVKGEGGITNYVDVTYNYRLTKDVRKKGWLLYAKGFYATGEAKSLTVLDIPAELNVLNATASAPDLKWEMKGLFIGVGLEL